MATIINADTSEGLKLTSDTSGEIALQSAGTTIATVSSTGITMASGKLLASTGPAFSAYMSSNQVVSTATFTKLSMATEELDSHGNYDTSLYRFTPSVEGHYQVNFQASGQTITSGQFLVSVFQNGSESQGVRLGQINGQGDTTLSGSTVIYCNGTTDYLDFYVYHTYGSDRNILGQYRYTRASAYLVRAA